MLAHKVQLFECNEKNKKTTFRNVSKEITISRTNPRLSDFSLSHCDLKVH